MFVRVTKAKLSCDDYILVCDLFFAANKLVCDFCLAFLLSAVLSFKRFASNKQ